MPNSFKLLSVSLVCLLIAIFLSSCGVGISIRPDKQEKPVKKEETEEKTENSPSEFLVYLKGRSGEHYADFIKSAEIEEIDGGYEFSLLQEFEGATEKSKGRYRKDGTLDYVYEEENAITHSWGEYNRYYYKNLIRQYSKDGKLKVIGGFIALRYIKSGEIEIEHITEDPKYNGGLYNPDMPPLKVDRELLKKIS